MPWFQRRERTALHLYGKLPLAKDYLRAGMGSGSTLALRDWMDQGYSGGANSEPPGIAHAARFLTGDGWGDTLQGVAWPSTDEGGLRPFPFVLCLERKRRALLDDVLEGMGRAQVVWERLRGVYHEALGMGEGGRVLSELRGTEIDVDEGDAPVLRGIDLDTWMAALWPETERDGFYEVLDALSNLADQSGHVRLPLVGDLSFRHQVHAWLTVLFRLGVLPEGECPSVFFPLEWPLSEESSTPSFLTVFRGRPAPADAKWLDAPTEQGTFGPGDLCPPDVRRVARDARPVTENIPPLRESLRGPLTRYMARTR